MLKKDFKQSNLRYLNDNKIALIMLAIFLVIGITMLSVWGLNGNFEMKGYYEFSVTVGEQQSENFVNDQREISKIIDSRKGNFDTISIYGEGDSKQYIVRYVNKIDTATIEEINITVADSLSVEVDEISEHLEIKPVVKTSDYLFAAASILVILLVATIFAYVRYNGASALAIILSSIIGTMCFLSICAILRLSVGMSYLAMLVILNILIIYSAIALFENMHKSSWLVSGDYNQALSEGIKASKSRILFIAVATMAIGVMFVLFGTTPIKYGSLNILFMAVIQAYVAMYIVPFVWNLFISHCRKREYKIKSTETKVAEIEE